MKKSHPTYLILLLLFTFSCFSQQSLTLSDTMNDYPINQYMLEYVDHTNLLEFSDMATPEFTTRFSPLSPDQSRLSSATHWLKLVVNNQSSKTAWVFKNAYVGIQHLDLYYFDSQGQQVHLLAGRLRPINSGYGNSFEISIPSNKQTTFYFQVKTNSPLILDFSLHTEQSFAYQLLPQNFFNGLFYGLMGFLFAVNLTFALILRIKSLGYLVTYLASMLLGYGFFDGFLLAPFPDSFAKYTGDFTLIFAAIGMPSLYQFCYLLLLRDIQPRFWQTIYRALVAIWLLILLCHYFYDPVLAYQSFMIAFTWVPICCLIMSLYALYLRRRHAPLIVAGLASLSIGFLQQLSGRLGLTVLGEFGYYLSGKVSILLLGFCLSIAMFNFVRGLRSQQLASERKVAQIFQQTEQMLLLADSDGKIISANPPVNNFRTADVQPENTIFQLFSPLKKHIDQEKFNACFSDALVGNSSELTLSIYTPKGTLHNIEFSFHPFNDDETKTYQVIVQGRDVTKQTLAINAIQDMVLGIAGLSADNFFNNVVLEISRIYQAKYVLLSLINHDGETATSLVLSINKRISANITYALAGTPSELLLSQHVANYPDNAALSFPEDEWLQRHHVRSYLGVPISDSENNVIGFLSVMDEKPMSEDHYFIEVLTVFASRAANELQQKKSQEQLKQALNKIDFHISNTPLGVIEWDNNHNIVNWNKAAERIFGFTLSDFTNQNALEILVPAADIKQVQQVSEDLLKNRGGQYSLNKNNTLDGRVILCEWYNTPLVDEYNQITGIASLVNDVTAEHEALNALYLKEQEQREIFNSLVDAVFIFDRQGSIETINKSASELFKYHASALIGQNFIELFSSDNQEQVLELMQLHLFESDLDDAGASIEVSAVNKQNHIFPIRLSLALLPATAKVQSRFVATCHDLTIFKQQQEAIKQSQKLDALGSLTGGIAHDFNNLLGIINGYSELLMASAANDSKTQKYATQIQNASARGAKLTKKLLSFASKSSVEAEQVNINELLQDSFEMLQKTITPRIGLTFDLEEGLPATAIDKAELEDSILNITINAMHAIEKQGEILIRTRVKRLDKPAALALNIKAGDYICLSIKDSGSGMSESTLQKALEPFFTTKGSDGTGLGLSQVYGFAERANGKLQIESTLGVGTTASLLFPIVTQSDHLIKEQPATPQKVTNTATILVVDDEPELVEISRAFLTHAGYKVFGAYSGKDALALISEHPFDLVLCDIIMPSMDGISLAEKTKKIKPQLPFLFASGFHDKELTPDQQTMMKNALRKPYRREELIKQVSQMLSAP